MPRTQLLGGRRSWISEFKTSLELHRAALLQNNNNKTKPENYFSCSGIESTEKIIVEIQNFDMFSKYLHF